MLKKSALIAWVIAAGVSGCGAFSVSAGEADTSGHPLEKDYQDKADRSEEPALRPILEGRVRFETVERDGYADASEAVTVRLRAGFEADLAPHTEFLIDFELVEALVDDYNSTTNGKTHLPKLADPEVSELNRLQLRMTAIDNTTITLGRQRIIEGDQRFIGNDFYRQNEQTFDAARIEITPAKGWNIDAGYIAQTNTVFGPESDKGQYTGDSVFGSVTRSGKAYQATLHTHFIDISEFGGKLSSQTFGIRASGKTKLHGQKLEWRAGYARQSDYASAPKAYDAEYYLLGADITVKTLRFGVTHEVLGSDTYQSFQTPLGSTHEYQGFANQFAVTPLSGVQDTKLEGLLYLKDFGPFRKAKAQAIYHHFEADDGSGKLGEEFDAAIGALWNKVGVKLKYADYRAAGFSKDTRKFAITAQVPFP